MRALCAAFLCALMLVQTVSAMPEREILVYTEPQDGVQSIDEDGAEGEDGAEAEKEVDASDGTGVQGEAGVELSAPSAILMEKETGEIVFEKNPDEQLAPASVTKIMTLLLIFDAIADGKLGLEDPVTTSEYAASMGGSQVFLEAGEAQTVDTMIKCIAVASANDACVAMAEHVCGSEEEFVGRMNERAQGLGMSNTHFVNCNGLDAEGHLTTARDIALMSRELITKYPQIRDYSMIWMEDITHNTQKGTSEFGLTNTNKLVRHYEYTTGLKTGSTGNAKFCISATAEKNGMELIAVIMAAENSKARTKDAIALLNYGFGKCSKFQEKEIPETPDAKVSNGTEDKVATAQEEAFTYVDTAGKNLQNMERKVEMKKLEAPVKQGDEAGIVRYFLEDQEIGTVKILTTESVEKMSYPAALGEAARELLL